MMTSAYLDAVRSSSSSIGGLVMPSGADTTQLSADDLGTEPVGSNGSVYQSLASGVLDEPDQLTCGARHIVVDHDPVEFLGGRELDPRLLETGGDDLVRLGATPGQ